VILDILESLEKVLHFFYYLQDMISCAHRSNKPDIQICLENKKNLIETSKIRNSQTIRPSVIKFFLDKLDK
jgi:hypothetical protein